ncbi:MAG: hypothetical protein JEY91_05650 [Spirochaetaceae bacterium]|nr:hypothetical protein [Spirochaetaceae bacterium]
MDAERIGLLRNKVTFISGSSKNSGKTTFLNYILPRLRLLGDLAFLSIGIDGEPRDRIFGTDKPIIKTERGDYLLTSESMMVQSDGSFEVLQVFPWNTALGKLLLLKTVREGFIELVGPENNNQLKHIIDTFQDSFGIHTVVIDGAVNRMTQISSSRESVFFYVIRITPDNISRSLDKIRVISSLSAMDTAGKADQNETVYFHNGALTGKVLKNIDEKFNTIVVDDFTKVFLDYRELQILLKSHKLHCKNKLNLEAFVLNLYDIEKSDVLLHLKDLKIRSPLIFNPYIIEGGGRID